MNFQSFSDWQSTYTHVKLDSGRLLKRMRLIGFTIVGALAFASCSKPASTEKESGPPGTPTPAEKPIAAATPEPSAPATPPPAAEAKPATAKAPDGVFYLISSVRVETSSGVQNLPVGTGVRLLRPGVYQTPVGEISLSAEKLTNDLATARAARDAAVAAEVASRPQTPPPKMIGAATAPKPGPTPDTSHEASVRAMKLEQADREIAALQKQVEALSAQQDALMAKKSKEDYNRLMKGRNVATTTDQQLSQIQVQMTAVQGRLNTAMIERRKIR